MKAEFELMFLKSERDCIEIDRNSTRLKLNEAKDFLDRLVLLDAPHGDRIRAKRLISKLENALEHYNSQLEGLRFQVVRAEALQAEREANSLWIESGN